MANSKEKEPLESFEFEEDEKDEDDDDERSKTQCGVGSCRPSWLQPLARMSVFTAILSAINIFGNMNYSYYTAVITQIERRYGLSSSMTGFIKNVDQIGTTCSLLLVSHFCRYSNKPVVFSIATVLTAIAIFVFALPHFLFGELDDDYSLMNVSQTSSNTTLSKYEYCDGVDESNADGSSCNSRNMLRPFNGGALAVFILSEFIQGVAQAPEQSLSLTYVDDNIKQNSPKHIGVMFGMRSFSPVLGFLMGAWATTIYVDLTDPGLGQRDPRWVGAWWLGFIICAGCSLFWAFPLLLFPREMKGAKVEQTKQKVDAKSRLKDLPRAFKSLCRNRVLMCATLGACCNVFIIGYSTFIPKYMELQFGKTASMSSILTGFISIFSWSVGPIVSGIVVARYKMNTHQLLRFVLIVNVVAGIGFMSMMFIGCPGSQWAGQMDLNSQNPNLACNGNCSCDPGLYLPVCGADGKTYFSSCYAGCTDHMDMDNGTTLFTGCGCIKGEDQAATPGVCREECNMLIAYLVIKSVSSFIISTSPVPVMTVILRSVGHKDKALGMAFMGFFTQICSFPSPMLFGFFIDSACMVTQNACGRKGACLLYDTDSFRYRLHGFAGAIKFLACLCYAYGVFITRNMKKEEEIREENSTAQNREKLNKDIVEKKEYSS